MESIFYYPVTLHQGNTSGSVVAPWVSELPLSSGMAPDPSVVVLSQNDSLPNGMYLWNGAQWRLAIPYTAIALAVISGALIELFYSVTQDYTALPAGAKLWKNSVVVQGTTVTAGVTSTWGAAYDSSVAPGSVHRSTTLDQMVPPRIPQNNGRQERRLFQAGIQLDLAPRYKFN